MHCILAFGGNHAPLIAQGLKKLADFGFDKWRFDCCASTNELLEMRDKRPDVVVVGRQLPGEKHSVLLKHIQPMFPASRIVLFIGAMDEEARAYEKMALEFDLSNIVKGVLPGERPYNLPAALLADIDNILSENVSNESVNCQAENIPGVAIMEDNDQAKCTDYPKEIHGNLCDDILAPEHAVEKHPPVAQTDCVDTPAERIINVRLKTRRLRRNVLPKGPGQEISDAVTGVKSLAPVGQVANDNVMISLNQKKSLGSIYNAPKEALPDTLSGHGEVPRDTIGKLIASIINKGGAGKTSVIIHTTEALARGGIECCLVDMDLYGPNVAVHYNINGVPGIELLADRAVSGALIENLLVKVKDNLYVLPGVMDKTEPYFSPGKLKQIFAYLLKRFPIVLVDTLPNYWQYDWLTQELLPMTDICLMVLNQSQYSIEDAKSYGPTKLREYGIKPDKIRLVINNFKQELMKVRDIEKAFNTGLKKPINASLVIPHDWVKYAQSTHRGDVVGMDDAMSQWYVLAQEIAEATGFKYNAPNAQKKKEKGILRGLWGKLKG